MIKEQYYDFSKQQTNAYEIIQIVQHKSKYEEYIMRKVHNQKLPPISKADQSEGPINKAERSEAQINPSCYFRQHQHTMTQIQLPDLPLNKKPMTKLDTNKHFSCLCIFENTVYLGTRNSKLYIYRIEMESQEYGSNDFSLADEKIITPHCEVVSLVLASDKYFVTVPESDEDSLISIWETQSRMLSTALKGHKSQISQIIFLNNNKYLASSSWDCSLRIWSLENFQSDEPLKTYTGNYPILQLKQLNQEVLVFGGDDCYLVFWNWKLEEVIKKQFGHAGSVTYIEVISPYVFTAGGDNKFKLWEVVQNNKQQEMLKENQLKSFLPKYSVQKIQEEKQQYDSIIFGVVLKKKQLLLMDRQGQTFILASKEITKLKNQFEYNENITGIDVYGDRLLVTTTKGCLKDFDLKEERRNTRTSLEESSKSIPEKK